jgi:prolyl 4-hydroxylase
MYAGHLDFDHPLVWTAADALTEAECAAFRAQMAAAAGAEVAPITGRDGEVVNPKIRSNTRLMFDDPAFAAALFERLRAHIPPRLMGLAVAGVNERLRLYRYAPGQRHGSHWDTPVELPDGRRTLLTLVIYLNEDFEGGATSFDELNRVIVPRRGLALFFQQRILHEAQPVIAGEKFVFRSDIFYRQPGGA